jgi:serine/threonine protein kinase
MIVCIDLRSGIGCNAVNSNTANYCIKCGQSLHFALRVHDAGTLIGQYRVVRMLGHGAFGAVYESEDTRRPGFSVAIKETLDPTSIRNFQGEFATLSRLRHDNLPRYHEMFEHQGNGYLVMEFIPGQDLEKVLQRQQGPLPEPQVLGYAVQICAALGYLHSQHPPILHRDIKPANIRLTPDGLIKLVDFGLLKEGGGTTRSSRMGGTFAYAPLEQYGGQGHHTDPRSDLYSLGATLYHLLTGQEPPPVTTRIAAAFDPLLLPRSYNQNLSPHVSAAVIKATSVRSQDRFASAEEFQRALLMSGQVQFQAAPTTRAAAPPPRAGTPPPRPPDYDRLAAGNRVPEMIPPRPPDYDRLIKDEQATSQPGSRRDTYKRKKALITYAPEDKADKQFAQNLAQVIRYNKVPIVEPEMDFTAGTSRDKAFREAIQDCTHLIVVLSPAGVALPEVTAQIGYALEHHLHIVPVVRKHCDIPLQISSFERVEFKRPMDDEAMAKVLRTFDTRFRKPGALKRGCLTSAGMVALGVIATLFVLGCLLQLLLGQS